MRIISGSEKSRKLKMVNIETTRETSDMVRESMFNLMNSYEKKGNVLDLFSGSGSIGLEALSRGAAKGYFNDLNKTAVEITLDNIKTLKYENKAFVSNLEYMKCLESLKNIKFNFIFLDPPYKLDCIDEILKFISENEMLSEDGLIVYESGKEYNYNNELFELYKEKKYGIKKVTILR
ncbi:MAG: 16S rRNA (guanine(966)-N(2))-methyltransferase RsmD [bacterium]